MSEIHKQITQGLVLVIRKRLSERLIDFMLENLTDFMFLFEFSIKQPQNVSSADGELEKQVQVLPHTSFTFMNLQIQGKFSYKYEFKYQKLSPEPIVKKITIAEQVFLTITQDDFQQKIAFELENKSEKPVHFEVLFMELSGIKTESGKLLFLKDLPGGSQSELCNLSFDGVWSYKYTYTFRFD